MVHFGIQLIQTRRERKVKHGLLRYEDICTVKYLKFESALFSILYLLHVNSPHSSSSHLQSRAAQPLPCHHFIVHNQ